MNETNEAKRCRGKGKKLALTHVNVRLPPEVLAYYKTLPNYTGKMREVLVQYATSATTT